MLYACLATFGCFFVGLVGLALSMADIEKFNFGLYLALLSVVGVTGTVRSGAVVQKVSIAFWIIAPAACANPRWMQRLTARYGYKFEPVRDAWQRHFGKKRRRKRRRSKGAKAAHRTSRVLIAFTRVGRDRDTEESRTSGKEVAAAGITARRGTDASRDTLTVPADNTTLPEEEELESESSMEEEADFCPLIASSLASVLAPTLASTRSIPKDQRPNILLPKMSVATKHSRMPDLETVGEQSAEVTVEAHGSTEPAIGKTPDSPVAETPAPESPVPVGTFEVVNLHSPKSSEKPEAVALDMEPDEPPDLRRIPDRMTLESPQSMEDATEFTVPVAVRYPERLIEVVVVKTGRKTSEIASPSFSSTSPTNGMKRSQSAVDAVQMLTVNFSQNSAVV